jgi:uncharacterized protein YciI
VPHFAVTVAHGPAWDAQRDRRGQDGWDEHAAFMDLLTADGFVILGGPLGDGTDVLLLVEGANADTVRARFADDPWLPAGVISIGTVTPWLLWLDGRRS